jgi:hypothetical protein
MTSVRHYVIPCAMLVAWLVGYRPCEAQGTAQTSGSSQTSGRVVGRVVSDVSGTPVIEARVVLFVRDGSKQFAADSDERGQFAFDGVPPGNYVIAATKSGYVRTEYDAGRPIRVVAGIAGSPITLRIKAGGVVMGSVTDEFGQPMANISVSVVRPHYVFGHREFATQGAVARTDDRGQFRIFALAPGQYYALATPPQPWAVEGDNRTNPNSNLLSGYCLGR